MLRFSTLVALCTCVLIVSGCSSDEAGSPASDSAGGANVGNPGTSSPGVDAGLSGGGGSDAGSGGTATSDVSSGGWDAGGAPLPGEDAGEADEEVQGNTNVSLSGGADIGFFRRLLDNGQVPQVDDITAEGFFAEHHTPLPAPVCGERICLQAMLGVMGNLINGNNCTMLQLGLNSPIVPDPTNRPPLSLAVVVDVSGSMDGSDKIGFVRDGLEELIDAMQDDDQLAIITYSDVVTTAYEMGPVIDNRGDMRAVVRGLVAEGGTDLHGGLQQGYREVLANYDSGRQNRVILISDGQPTSGVIDAGQIISMSSGYNSEGLGLTTVGLGVDFNIDLMQGLARTGDGNFYFVENAGAVSEVFSDELSYFTVPVAFDLTLEVTMGRDYDMGAVRGSSFWEDTETGGFIEVPSVFLAHRESHEDVTDEGGRRGGGSALLVELMPNLANDGGSVEPSTLVATVDVSFREPGSDEIITDQVTVTYPFAADVVEERGFWDAPDLSIVHKSFVMLNIFVGMQSACQMFHLGASDEAIGSLTRLIAAVEDYNEEVEDVDIDYDLDLLYQLLGNIEANSPEPVDEPVVPEDPWPVD